MKHAIMNGLDAHPLLTASEVAARLNISRATLYRLAEAGMVPAVRVGSQWRFSDVEIEDWLQSVGTRGR